MTTAGQLATELATELSPMTLTHLVEWAARNAAREQAQLRRLRATSPGFTTAWEARARWRAVHATFSRLAELEAAGDAP